MWFLHMLVSAADGGKNAITSSAFDVFVEARYLQ